MLPDLENLPNTFKLEIKTAPYKEYTIEKEIYSFVNDGFKNIQKAEELSFEEVFSKLPKELNYLLTLA